MIHPTSNIHTTRKTVKWGRMVMGFCYSFLWFYFSYILQMDKELWKWQTTAMNITCIFNKNSYSVQFRGSRGSEYYAFASKTTLFGVFFFIFLAVGNWFHRMKYPVAFKLMMMAAHNLRCARFVVFSVVVFFFLCGIFQAISTCLHVFLSFIVYFAILRWICLFD